VRCSSARSRPTPATYSSTESRCWLRTCSPGVTGRELFDLACGLAESEGYLTQRTARHAREVEGSQLSLGHGIGLEVHESPAVGVAGRDRLVAGDVLALEPGLFDSRIGEVRFEDLVLETELGCETLTRFPYDLAPST
jgi:Xaa-Pro aminopeptidase